MAVKLATQPGYAPLSFPKTDFETCQTSLKLANAQENHLLNASWMIHLEPLHFWNDEQQQKLTNKSKKTQALTSQPEW